MKPTFGAGRPVSEEFDLGFQLIYSLFGSSELHRKLMRQLHGAVAVFIRQVSGLLDLCNDGFSGLFHLKAITARPFFRYKFKDLFGRVGAVLLIATDTESLKL